MSGNAGAASLPERSHLPEPPIGWSWVTVADLGGVTEQAVLTGPFGTSLGTHDFTPEGVPVLTIGCLADGGIRLDQAAFVSREKASELARYRLEAGDVLFSRMASVGRAAVVKDAIAGALINYHIMRLRLNREAVLPTLFVAYVRGAKQVQDYLREVNHGATRDGINTQQLLAMPVVLPPLPEQHRIVAEIEKQLSRLDAGVAALKRVQANLKRYRAAVLHAACTGRLVPTEAELARAEGRDFESADQLLDRISAERRGERNWKHDESRVATHPSSTILPGGWAWTDLIQLLGSLRNGLSTKPDASDGTAILRISAVRPLRVNAEDVRFLPTHPATVNDYLLDTGDLLFTRYNGNPDLVGVCGVVGRLIRPTAHPDKLIRGKVASALINPRFLQIVLNVGAPREFIRSRVRTTAGQVGISGGDLKATPVPVAPLAEQHRIVAEVERRLSIIDEIEALVVANLKRAERLRQAILKRAFEGKLVPQDPNDEPASVLLERIRAERAAMAANGAQRPARRGAASSAAGAQKGGSHTGANRTARQRVLEL
jgi:type I restriction enzyme, S subunit